VLTSARSSGSLPDVTEPLDCPNCGATAMSAGVVVARPPGVKFRPATSLGREIAWYGDTSLTRGRLTPQAPAHRCDSCGTVVIPPAP